MSSQRQAKPRHMHLGVETHGATRVQANLAAAGIATLVVEAAATGPILITLDGHIGVVWRDAHGWQSQIYGAQSEPTMRTRSAYGGVPTIERALLTTAAGVAQNGWSMDQDDRSYFGRVLGCLCQPMSATASVLDDLLRWADWQRLQRMAVAAGIGRSAADDAAYHAQTSAPDREAFLQTIWRRATDDAAFLSQIDPVLQPCDAGAMRERTRAWIIAQRSTCK